MSNESSVVREVEWTEVFPWLNLFRCVRLAMEVRKLFLSAVAMMLVIWGWCGIASVFSGSSDPRLKEDIFPAYTTWPWESSETQLETVEPAHDGRGTLLGEYQRLNPLYRTWQRLSDPFIHLFDPQTTAPRLAFYVLCGLWGVIVWGLFGGMISRMTALQLGRDERSTIKEAFKYAIRYWGKYLSSPLFPMFTLFILFGMIAVPALMMGTGVGTLIASIGWGMVLIFSFLATILIVGLLVCWPLMWATISVEASDSFDAMSRSYGYLFQRPFHFGFYTILATILGIIGWWFVQWFGSILLFFSVWSASWGAGNSQIQSVINDAPTSIQTLAQPMGAFSTQAASLEGVGDVGAIIISYWMGLIFVMVLGYAPSYFWTVATAIYLLLRHDVDDTDLDEVYVDQDDEDDTFGIPPFEGESNGSLPIIDPPNPEPENNENTSSTD